MVIRLYWLGVLFYWLLAAWYWLVGVALLCVFGFTCGVGHLDWITVFGFVYLTLFTLVGLVCGWLVCVVCCGCGLLFIDFVVFCLDVLIVCRLCLCLRDCWFCGFRLLCCGCSIMCFLSGYFD